MNVRLALCVLALAAGCGPSGPYLQWDMRIPAYQIQGRVAVKTVANMRPAKHGADELNNLGNERSAVGIPFAVRLEDGTSLDQDLSKLVTEAMASAGVGSAAMGDPNATAQLVIEIRDLWCDGYAAYTATVELALVLLDPPTGSVRTRVPIRKEGQAGNCHDAYHNALTGVSQEVAIAFGQPQVRMAAVGGGAAPPVAKPQSAPRPTIQILSAPQPEQPTSQGRVVTEPLPPEEPASPPPPPPRCAPGKQVGPQTAGRCCWPGQSWSEAANHCVGPPQCPEGWYADEGGCVAATPPAKKR